MAAGAGEGSGAGGAGIIEGDAAAFEGGGGGVVKPGGGFDDWLCGVGEVDDGDGIFDRIEDPGLGGRAIFV